MKEQDGINGEAAYGLVSDCMNNGSITGNGDVGGINGVMFGTVNKCYNLAPVTGRQVGGIAGEIGTKCTGVITNCYNMGDIATKSEAEKKCIGGIIGWVSATETNGTISNNYNAGTIEASEATEAGNILGHCTTQTFTIKNNYYLKEKCNKSTNTVGEEKEEAYMKTQDFVDELNAEQEQTVWSLKKDDYPVNQ